jgi:hypothetical protein
MSLGRIIFKLVSVTDTSMYKKIESFGELFFLNMEMLKKVRAWKTEETWNVEMWEISSQFGLRPQPS